MTLTYRPHQADARPLPAKYRSAARYLGYRDEDYELPFAHFFRATAEPMQSAARENFDAGQQPATYGFEITEAADVLSRPGYQPLETGWLRTNRGTLLVANLTDMPGVTADMWDWWFGWHSCDSARYKLWHPEAHQFAAIAENRTQEKTLSDRQRYQNNTSFVDEYVGASYSRLAIRFIDPTTVGFEERAGTTVICAAVGLSAFPVVGGWLIHQVRPTDNGVEMRSRFILGDSQIIGIPADSTTNPVATRLLTNPLGRRCLAPIVNTVAGRQTTDRFARDLGQHCATEMNHLASFLPGLYTQFRDSP